MTTAPTNAPASAGFPSDLTPAQLLYPDLRTELATTRRTLERVPDEELDWRPHDKSTTIGRLATHLSQLPSFATTMLTSSELDVATTTWPSDTITTTAERLALFDSLAADMVARVEAVEWPALGETWTLRAGDHVILRETKRVLLRSLVLSHMAHHRAQLGVYLRLRGVPVPGVYGPSADER
ncbi:MAG TPA: DinB family protein [Gemmatimonadaceae bacterium]|nr:DinB family protein [Gemmatimonadaceae bacterium]